ncbi:MAG TPA: thioredoxin family protein [Rudaea sp.]|jgi:peroxiredoxin
MATTAPPGELGSTAPDFRLPGIDSRPHALADLRGANGTLVAFICNHCPYVRAIRTRLVRDARELQTLGVGVVAINSNDAVAYPDDSFDNMRRIASEWQLPFPYLHDESQQIARAYGAVCTPDFFGYDAQLKLRYRGRLDSSGKEARPDAVRELFDSMRAIASGGAAPGEQHPSIGCSIKWKRPG